MSTSAETSPPVALYTVADAVKALRLSRAQLYKEMAAGHLRYVHVGRARRIPADAITDYVTFLNEQAARDRTDEQG